MAGPRSRSLFLLWSVADNKNLVLIPPIFSSYYFVQSLDFLVLFLSDINIRILHTFCDWLVVEVVVVVVLWLLVAMLLSSPATDGLSEVVLL